MKIALWGKYKIIEVDVVEHNSQNTKAISNFYRQHCAQCKVPVFNLLRGQFWAFCPTGATHCTDAGEIWRGEGDQMSPLRQISPPSVQQ